ncbi:MAG: hypothetical protein LBD88_00330, partial [Candidatus Peribacteria bacterium]|nr:hypothetical protein [Candidatus Peribacteria bacterium]
SHITDHKILFFASVILSSLHLEVNIFIQANIIIIIAIPTRAIFINPTTLLIVSANQSGFINKF